MRYTHRHLFFIILLMHILLLSCTGQQHTSNEIELAMKQYDHLIKKMDTDSIALLYTADGDLGNMAHGRDSIRKFLDTFKNFKVLSQSSTSDSIKISGDSSFQKGVYHQTVIVAPKDTVTVKGSYTALWLWVAPNGWQIKRMDTKPMK